MRVGLCAPHDGRPAVARGSRRGRWRIPPSTMRESNPRPHPSALTEVAWRGRATGWPSVRTYRFDGLGVSRLCRVRVHPPPESRLACVPYDGRLACSARRSACVLRTTVGLRAPHDGRLACSAPRSTCVLHTTVDSRTDAGLDPAQSLIVPSSHHVRYRARSGATHARLSSSWFQVKTSARPSGSTKAKWSPLPASAKKTSGLNGM